MKTIHSYRLDSKYGVDAQFNSYKPEGFLHIANSYWEFTINGKSVRSAVIMNDENERNASNRFQSFLLF